MKKESITTKKVPVKPTTLLKTKPKQQHLKSKPKKKPVQTNSRLLANMTNSIAKETSE